MRLADLFENNRVTTKPLKIKNGVVKLMVRSMGRDRFSFQVLGKTQELAFGEFQGFERNGEHCGSVEEIVVSEKYRRRGIATAVYDYFQSLGYKIVPSDSLKPDGLEFWKSRQLFEDDEPTVLRIRLGQTGITPDCPAKKFMTAFEAATQENFLNPRKRQLGLAHVELVVANRNTIHIGDIQSHQPGHGGRLMKLICELADQFDVKLTLWVEGYEETSDDQLFDWYGRLGFVSDSDDAREMTRWPRAS